MATVAVSGASGFLGRHVARVYSAAGWRVVGIGLDDWPEAEWRSWGLASWVVGDASVEAFRSMGVTPDVVAHCAGSGSVGFSFQDPAEDFRRTVGTLEAMLEFVRQDAPRARVVYPSSAAVYGVVESLPIREDARLRPASPYGTHKVIAEELCRGYASHFGLQIAVVRYFSLYGPELRKQLLWDACTKFGRAESGFLGTGDEIRDWLHVSDAAGLLRAGAEHASSACPIVNGGSGEGTHVREVLSRLRKAFPGAPPLTFTATARAGDPTAYVADTSKATAWGWRPSVGLTEGLDQYVEWFLRNRR